MKLLGQRNPPIKDNPNREVRMTIVSVCDWGARLDGTVNASEQPYKHRDAEKAKDADKPEPKGK